MQQLTDQYVAFVLRRFGKKAHVVFDGYSGGASIKDHEHARRAGKVTKVAPHVHLQLQTVMMFDQDSVLANDSNKQQLITLLSQQLQCRNVATRQSTDDADVDIVAVALDIAGCDKQTVAVYAEDTDILALLIHHRRPDMGEIFMFSDRKSKSQADGKCIRISEMQSHLGVAVCRYVLVIHSFGGCDTTSAIYGRGKATSCPD